MVVRDRAAAADPSLSRFSDTANLLTIVQTCHFQQRCVIDFFGEALRAHIGNQISYPSLIPIV